MILDSYLFAFERNSNDIHSQVFNTLKDSKIIDFTNKAIDKKPILLFATAQQIICRTNAHVVGISTKESRLEVELDDHLKGILTIPMDLPRMVMNMEQVAEYIKEHNKKPKYNQTHKYYRMNEEQAKEYALNQLNKAGLEVLEDLRLIDVGKRQVSGTKKVIKAMDVGFRAKITDLDKLKFAWFHGVCRNKTYGFGMIRAIKVAKDES
jgi:hypothetical protein